MNRIVFRNLLICSLSLFFLLSGIDSTQAQDLPVPAPSTALNLQADPCQVELDGKMAHLSLPLRLSPENHSLISIQDVILLFSCHLEFDPRGGLHIHHLDKAVDFEPGEFYSTHPGETLTPLQQLQAFYVPLQTVAMGMGYVVEYKQGLDLISVNSPTYIEPKTLQPQSTPTKNPNPLPAPPEKLPAWGILGSELAARWPEEKIIAGYYTTLINSPAGRTNNIVLSCSSIDGTILEPNQVFSFNKVVGERTVQAGYEEAKIFVGNQVSTGLGGGICQTASTLYNAAIECGLQIIERNHHSLKVTYVAPDQDATVSWGSADLKFRNNLGRPFIIRTCVYGPYVLAAFCEVH